MHYWNKFYFISNVHFCFFFIRQNSRVDLWFISNRILFAVFNFVRWLLCLLCFRPTIYNKNPRWALLHIQILFNYYHIHVENTWSLVSETRVGESLWFRENFVIVVVFYVFFCSVLQKCPRSAEGTRLVYRPTHFHRIRPIRITSGQNT